MIDKKYLANLAKVYKNKTQFRQKLIGLSSQALVLAKQAIFILQRGEIKNANKLLQESRILIKQAAALCRDTDELEWQGAYRQAMEELVEATLFYNFLRHQTLGQIKEFKPPLEVYLGGLTDFVGELVRLATTYVIQGKITEIKPIIKVADEVMSELVKMNLVGYLRTKFDQAKNASRKLQDIQYDLTLRNK